VAVMNSAQVASVLSKAIAFDSSELVPRLMQSKSRLKSPRAGQSSSAHLRISASTAAASSTSLSSSSSAAAAAAAAGAYATSSDHTESKRVDWLHIAGRLVASARRVRLSCCVYTINSDCCKCCADGWWSCTESGTQTTGTSVRSEGWRELRCRCCIDIQLQHRTPDWWSSSEPGQCAVGGVITGRSPRETVGAGCIRTGVDSTRCAHY